MQRLQGLRSANFQVTTVDYCLYQVHTDSRCRLAGWNGLESLTFKTLDLAEPDSALEKHQKLGQYMATPIAGGTRQLIPRTWQIVSCNAFYSRQ
jgi:hypothetical protein